MPIARPICVNGRLFPSARKAATAIHGTAAGISIAIQRGGGEHGVYLGYTVAWAAPVPAVSRRKRRDVRHRLQWAGLDPAVQAELLATPKDDLRAMVAGTVHGPDAHARAIGADLVLRRGAAWLAAGSSGGAS